MIGIDVPALRPAERLDRGLCGVEHALRLGADEGVFAVGFVPHGHDRDTLCRGALEGLELGFGLMGETVAHADGEFFESQHAARRVAKRKRGEKAQSSEL